jgi:hypothetical protein
MLTRKEIICHSGITPYYLNEEKKLTDLSADKIKRTEHKQ